MYFTVKNDNYEYKEIKVDNRIFYKLLNPKEHINTNNLKNQAIHTNKENIKNHVIDENAPLHKNTNNKSGGEEEDIIASKNIDVKKYDHTADYNENSKNATDSDFVTKQESAINNLSDEKEVICSVNSKNIIFNNQADFKNKDDNLIKDEDVILKHKPEFFCVITENKSQSYVSTDSQTKGYNLCSTNLVQLQPEHSLKETDNDNYGIAQKTDGEENKHKRKISQPVRKRYSDQFKDPLFITKDQYRKLKMIENFRDTNKDIDNVTNNYKEHITRSIEILREEFDVKPKEIFKAFSLERFGFDLDDFQNEIYDSEDIDNDSENNENDDFGNYED